MKDIYITQNGKLERKDNSIKFSNDKVTKLIPINSIDSIHCIAEVSVNSKLLNYLTKFQIPVYFYNYFGFYCGVYAPRKEAVSGKLLVEQVKNYDNDESRLLIAKEILNGALHNIIKTLYQYGLEGAIEYMAKFKDKINEAKDIGNLMLVEAKFRKYYYKQFNKILKNKEFEFVMRVKRPPDNFVNTLISFGNSLLYTTTLSEIFKTQLSPLVSFLHEPFERRYSLNLDIAEIFKPLIVDRVIFTLINKKMIKSEHFDKNLNYCYLNKEGRHLFLREYDNKLKQTIRYPSLGRKVSYRYMLRLECYKLIKHLLESKDYKSFKIYW